MPIIVPFQPSRPFYELETVIENAVYLFDVKWNARDNNDLDTGEALGAWYFDVYDDAGEALICGVKIVCGAYLGRTCTHDLFQRGVFVAVDTEGTRRDPGLDDIGEGKRVEVRYYTLPEVFGAEPDIAIP